MRIRYHFIVKLHITKTRSILFLTKYGKNNIIEWVRAHAKTGFSVNDWKSSKALRRIKRNFSMYFDFRLGWTFHSVHVSAVPKLTVSLKRPSHGKLNLANSCWQTQVGVCERHKNSRQTRFYLTPTVCKRVCRLFLWRSHAPTWVCQHKFANLSLPCEGRFTQLTWNTDNQS